MKTNLFHIATIACLVISLTALSADVDQQRLPNTKDYQKEFQERADWMLP